MKTKKILLNTVEKVKEFNRRVIGFPDNMDIVSGRYRVSAKSLMGIFSLDLSKPVELVFDEKYESIAELYFKSYEVTE
jgi:hypothetical protein